MIFKKGVNKFIMFDCFTVTFYLTFNTNIPSTCIISHLSFLTKNHSQVEISVSIQLLLSFYLEEVDCFIL